MCGISGLVNCGDRETLARMTRVQAHRGPDDSGVWERQFPDGSYVGLGSRRLAILDLSADGHMPMCNQDRSVWITYNGEIYNFRELRRELESHGYGFTSHTDTEVILHLYEQDGPDCVKRLNGMFAFAICDMRPASPLLFMARDHFGVKPLYYFHDGRKFAFASEIKALLQIPGVDAQLDAASLDQYLTFLWVPDPKTMFRGIRKLRAGHSATLHNGELKLSQYWDLTFPPAEHCYERSEADLTDEVRERFRRSVEAQMVSDVPIGAFLSAGLDSSSIVAMMRRATNHPVRTYTITFPRTYRVGETTLDDPEVATRLSRRLGCENQRIVVEPDVTNLLPKLVWHMDEPTADPAIITAYLVCREARKQATVLLSGVGGDELFAGYRKHVAHYWAQAYNRVPSPARGLFEAALAALPALRGTALKGRLRLTRKMARSAAFSPIDRFVTNCTYLDTAQRTALYADLFAGQLEFDDPAGEHRAAFDRVGDADFLHQMLYLDTKIFMTSLNLTYNDKMSMASSVEVRVPFLDRDLAEFAAWNIPPGLKLKGRMRPTTKYIFRQAMRDILPREVLQQPKAGFAAPVDYWLANDLKEMTDDLLSDSQIRRRGLFQPAAVRRLVANHRSGRQDCSMQIWQFLTLELWMQTFLDGAAEKFEGEALPPSQVATA
ncbi:MAG TPA: asparagine synthase (glutamine-hydrolyzing) [Verrucomicrobiae bacterium]|nr:asparagine synthase (glutamine-hydrolyzing) [Verrucomicrobiae bacterium]